MRTWIAAVVVAAGLSIVGCKSDDMNGSSTTKMADACQMCEGMQKGTAAGTCEKCGMKLTDMQKSSMQKTSMGDACTKCEGVQTANAAGQCPMCKM